MKTTVLAVAVSFALSGWAFAQKAEQKQEPSAMEHMMKEGGKDGEHMDRMARMMKMMDQCSKMMESEQSNTGGVKQSRM